MSLSSGPHPDVLPAGIYQEVFRRADDAMVIFRPRDEIILDVNPKAEKLFGYTRSELAGMSWKQLALDVARGEECVAQLLRTGRCDPFETACRRRDGVVLALAYSGSVFQVQGEPVILGIVQDLAASKQLEREPQRLNLDLHVLLDDSPLGVVALDRQGKVLRCNRAFTAMTQWTEQELMSGDFDDLITPASLKQEAQSLTAAAGRGERFHLTTRRRKKDGTLVDVEIHGVPLMLDRKAVGSYGLYQDVTERVSLRHQLSESQRLDALGRLAGGVAHDLNNMLMAIAIHAQLLHSKLELELQPHTRQICLATDRASATVQELLAFSRRRPASPQLIPLNATISSALAVLLRPLLREELDLRFISHAHELYVRMDPNHLTQVLVNLVLNARDAIEGRGAIFLRTGIRAIDSQEAPLEITASDYALIEVHDTGCGMTPEVKERIFEPFFTTKEIGKGTGLGLSTVYGIVKQSKGTIEVWSQLGQGSQFQVLLPLEKEPESERPAVAEPAVRGGQSLARETILLVEDEEAAREAIAEFLKNMGYKVLEAANGREALALFQGNPQRVDLVISDLIMPSMNGAEMAREMWKSQPLMPLIFMSGHGDEEVRAKTPADAQFFHKPFRLEKLAKALRETLDKKNKAKENGENH